MNTTYKKTELESDLQTQVIKYAKRRGWLAQKLVSESANGWPDLLVMRRGQTVLLETKTTAGRLSANQRMRHIDIEEHGGYVFTIDTIEQAHVILR